MAGLRASPEKMANAKVSEASHNPQARVTATLMNVNDIGISGARTHFQAVHATA